MSASATAAPATSRVYRTQVLVRFADCDPAGIVFFPRYLEMFNNLVEDWCRDALDVSFGEIHTGRGFGLPTVHLEVDFAAPSRVGEVLQASLSVQTMGRSSLTLSIRFQGPSGEDRVRGQMIVVLTDPQKHRGVTIPDELRARISPFHAHA